MNRAINPVTTHHIMAPIPTPFAVSLSGLAVKTDRPIAAPNMPNSNWIPKTITEPAKIAPQELRLWGAYVALMCVGTLENAVIFSPR